MSHAFSIGQRELGLIVFTKNPYYGFDNVTCFFLSTGTFDVFGFEVFRNKIMPPLPWMGRVQYLELKNGVTIFFNDLHMVTMQRISICPGIDFCLDIGDVQLRQVDNILSSDKRFPLHSGKLREVRESFKAASLSPWYSQVFSRSSRAGSYLLIRSYSCMPSVHAKARL
jgi:hypothetical protein